MLFFENISVAIAGLKANKMRSLLTMLGIIIGITSVIIIFIVGNSVTKGFSKILTEAGADTIEVVVLPKNTKNLYNIDDNVREMNEKDLITKDMLNQFKEEYKDKVVGLVQAESVYGDSMDGKGTVTRDNVVSKVQIRGYSKDYYKYFGNRTKMVQGRGFLDRDYAEGKRVCLVADKLVERAFRGDKDAAIGSEIEVNMNGVYYTYHIVGIYEYSRDGIDIGGTTSDPENPTTEIRIPYETARIANHAQNEGTQYIDVVVDSEVDGQAFAPEIRDYFNVKYYAKNDAYNVVVISMADQVQEFTSMFDMVKIAFLGVAAISLLVGSIGVTNIMLVSVTERTKEIGTRKALGATNKSIRLQFITEAIVICFIGGAVGVFLGITAGTALLNLLPMDLEPAIDATGIIISVLISVAVGIIAGYSPANRAAKLNPIDALRYE